MDWFPQKMSGVSELALRTILLQPDSGAIVGLEFQFDHLDAHRNADGIVGQLQIGDAGKPATWDGGDSAHKTGILAFLGSDRDAGVLSQFENGDGIMVRCPNDPKWSDPDYCSRDQLIAFAAGCWRNGNTAIVRRLLEKTVERGYLCQNIYESDGPRVAKIPDPVFPHEQMFLRICSGDSNACFDPIGQLILQVQIEWAGQQPIDYEINQLALEAVVCCRLDHFVKHIPDYGERLHYYWSRRQQGQVSEGFVALIEHELKRYREWEAFPFPPLPIETINAIATMVQDRFDAATHINWWLDTKNLTERLPGHFEMAIRSAVVDSIDRFKFFIELTPKLADLSTSFVKSTFSFGGVLGGRPENDKVMRKLSEIENLINSNFALVNKKIDSISAQISEIISFLNLSLTGIVQDAVRAIIIDDRLSLITAEIRNATEPSIRNLRKKKYKDIEAVCQQLCTATGGHVAAVEVALRNRPWFPSQASIVIFLILRVCASLARYPSPLVREFLSQWLETIVAAIDRSALSEINSSSIRHMLEHTVPSRDVIAEAGAKMDPNKNKWHPFIGCYNEDGRWWGVFAELHDYNPATGWRLIPPYSIVSNIDGSVDQHPLSVRQHCTERSAPAYDACIWFSLFKGKPNFEKLGEQFLAYGNELSRRGRAGATRDVLEYQIQVATQLRDNALKIAESLTD